MNTKLMKFVKPFAAFAACALVSFPAAADDYYQDMDSSGIMWSYKLDGGKAIIEGREGSDGRPQKAVSPYLMAMIDIPSRLGGYDVKAVGRYAFYDTRLGGISDWGVVTEIGERSFMYCDKLLSIEIPDRVTGLGKQAFKGCIGLNKMAIGNGVTAIPDQFASECNNLSDLTIGSNVKSIGEGAFSYSSRLYSVTIPEKVTSLGAGAFSNCKNLRIAFVPISMKGRFNESDVFSNCASSLLVYYYGTAKVNGYTWSYIVLNGSAEIYDIVHSETAISPLPTGSVTIPEAIGGYPVTCINIGAFLGCSGMSSVTIPTSVKRIATRAFSGCSGLMRVDVPDSVLTIENSVFDGCTKLVTAYLPKALLGNVDEANVFPNCASTLSVLYRIDASASKYAQKVNNRYWYFQDTSPLQIVSPGAYPVPTSGVLDIPATLGGKAVKAIGSYAFEDFTRITGIAFPSSLTTIGSKAFLNCDSLTSVTIPNTVTSVSDSFQHCDRLQTIVIGNGIKTIPGGFAYGCASLLDVTFGSNVKTIESSGAFACCTSLSSITIPETITSIGDGAFADCTRLATANLPMALLDEFDESNVFSGCPGGLNVYYYGAASVSGRTWHYRTTSESGTAEIFNNGAFAVSPAPTAGAALEVPAKIDGFAVTAIGDGAFTGGGMGSVVLPNTVTSIGLSAFADCTRLKSVTEPSALETIGELAFMNCSSLASFAMPDGVTSIGMGAFAGTGLKTFSFGKGVTSIPSMLFNYCATLTSVAIPKSVTEIDVGAFSGCPALSLVTVSRGDAERIDGLLTASGFDTTGLTYEDEPVPSYTIRFHRYDASDEKTEAYDFDYGIATKLPKLNELGWARRGFDFKGWATSQANAAAGKVWKADGAVVSTAAAAGKTLEVWAVWELRSDSYAIQFIRNDGAGTWRIVGFKYGVKTRMPSLAKGLGWGRRGYQFNGWALSAANANNGKIWKGDWANIAEPTSTGTMLTVYASWTLKPGFYQVRFNKNDGSGKWRTLGFECGASAKLNTIAGLGWTRAGHPFKGWASNKANADAKKLWKTDGAWVKDATAEGKTLSIYAIWQ